MPIPNPSIAFALFDERSQAETGLEKLGESGFSPDQVELTAKTDAPPAQQQAGQDGILSPVRTLLLGENRSAVELFERLVDLGIPEHEARYYRHQVEAGKLLATVISLRREREAADILRDHGGRGAFESQPEVTAAETDEPQRVTEDVAVPDDVTAS